MGLNHHKSDKVPKKESKETLEFLLESIKKYNTQMKEFINALGIILDRKSIDSKGLDLADKLNTTFTDCLSDNEKFIDSVDLKKQYMFEEYVLLLEKIEMRLGITTGIITSTITKTNELIKPKD